MFQIDFKSRRSVRDQIVDNFKHLINTGLLQPMEEVPNIEEISIGLVINPNTCQKAYTELENQGYFYSHKDASWMVADRSTGNPPNLAAKKKNKQPRNHEYFVIIEDLTKHLGDNLVLNDLKMDIKRGSIYGLMGVNGSGKTTLIKHLAKIYQSDFGEIIIDEVPIKQVSQLSIGYLPDETAFLPHYTMRKMSSFFENKHKRNWDFERYQDLLQKFDLDEEQKLDTFSSGMKKQAALVFALSAMPDLLLLDETLDGLDPFVRHYVAREIIKDVAERQMTVFVTSHNINELDGICDTVGIIDKGQVTIERDIDDLRSNIHKINVAFAPGSVSGNPFKGLNVLYREDLGGTDLVVIHGLEAKIAASIGRFNPILYHHMPMTLEEIFVYEKSEEKPEE